MSYHVVSKTSLVWFLSALASISIADLLLIAAFGTWPAPVVRETLGRLGASSSVMGIAATMSLDWAEWVGALLIGFICGGRRDDKISWTIPVFAVMAYTLFHLYRVIIVANSIGLPTNSTGSWLGSLLSILSAYLGWDLGKRLLTSFRVRL